MLATTSLSCARVMASTGARCARAPLGALWKGASITRPKSTWSGTTTFRTPPPPSLPRPIRGPSVRTMSSKPEISESTVTSKAAAKNPIVFSQRGYREWSGKNTRSVFLALGTAGVAVAAIVYARRNETVLRMDSGCCHAHKVRTIAIPTSLRYTANHLSAKYKCDPHPRGTGL